MESFAADSPDSFAVDMEYSTQSLLNCSYLYDFDTNSDTHALDLISLYLDGPITLVFAVLALIGGRLAVKFLGRACLNRDLTSGIDFNFFLPDNRFQHFMFSVSATLF